MNFATTEILSIDNTMWIPETYIFRYCLGLYNFEWALIFECHVWILFFSTLFLPLNRRNFMGYGVVRFVLQNFSDRRESRQENDGSYR